MAKHNIVLVGGGFACVKAALELADDDRFSVTLISDHADFRIYGTLYRVTTGGARRLSSIPLHELFEQKNVTVLIDTAQSIDRAARTVTTATGATIHYDAIVLALGVKTNYFHIQGLEEYSYGIKTPDDAESLKLHLHKQLVEQKKLDLNYVVIGGGPTGVELAGALPSYIKKIAHQHGLTPRKVHVDLVEAAPHVLPRMPKHFSRRVERHLRSIGVKLYLKTAVQAQTADALMANNKPIRSHTVIWTAGVSNHSFFTEQGFQIAKNGKVRVDQFMQAEPAIYVLGDNADTPYSGMAQTALHDGKFMAKHLKRIADKKPLEPYVAKRPVYVFPAGPKWAAVQWGPVSFYGRDGWLLRLMADLIAYHDYEPWKQASKRWLAESVDEEMCPHCS